MVFNRLGNVGGGGVREQASQMPGKFKDYR